MMKIESVFLSFCVTLVSLSGNMGDVEENNLKYFKARLEPYGFEVHPFLVQWYNELVDKPYALDYPNPTLAYIVVSTPSMFEKVFIPYIKSLSDSELEELRDPINTAVRLKMEEAKQGCTVVDNKTIDILYDYEMVNRKPVILVQTAGDVAGAVRLYQGSDLDESHQFKTPYGKVFPCALHPKYGGWFAFRAAFVFKTLTQGDLVKPPRLDILKSQSEIQDFLEKANLRWQDWSYRDLIEPVERYSEIQRRYFGMEKTEDRKKFLPSLKNYDTSAEGDVKN